MPALCLCYVVHEPYNLRHYTVFDLGQNSVYEDDDRNCDHMLHAARACYLPMNDLMLRLIKRHGKAFKVAFSISGTALDQFEQYAPEVIDSFKALGDTGCVEFMAETAPHSLAFLYSKAEFEYQISEHCARVKALFGQKPVTFRNSELVYNNDLGVALEKRGFKAVLAEGADHVLGWRSANYLYSPASAPKMRLLMRNASLSEDIGLRFKEQSWSSWPLTAEKFASWCHAQAGAADIINLFNDYHIFGLRHPKETGIFEFMEALPAAVLAHPEFSFTTPAEAARNHKSVGTVDVPEFMSWADEERDLKAWLGNDMQKDAIHALYKMAPRVRALADPELILAFERLQTSEHFHYISTKWFAGQLPDRLSPFASPYDAYITYMNVLADLEMRLCAAEQRHGEELNPAAAAPTPAGKGTTSGQAAPAAKTAAKTSGQASGKAAPAAKKGAAKSAARPAAGQTDAGSKKK